MPALPFVGRKGCKNYNLLGKEALARTMKFYARASLF
jgi:hypothetical protein